MGIRKITRIDVGDGQIVRGTRHDDDLTGSVGDDVIHGFRGDDIVVSSGGRDHIDGGWGFDIVSYEEMAESIAVILKRSKGAPLYVEKPATAAVNSLQRGSAEEGGGAHDKDTPVWIGLPGFFPGRFIKGTAQNDADPYKSPIPGYIFKDTLQRVEGVAGGTGDDWLIGDSRGNLFVGGPGEDVLLGGGGADSFVYFIEHTKSFAAGTTDVIAGFNPKEGDRIDLALLSEGIGHALTFVGEVSSYASDTPYSVFYRKGVDVSDNPLYGDSRFEDNEGKPLFKGEDGLSLMVDLDGDAHSDFMIAVWGVEDIRASDLIL